MDNFRSQLIPVKISESTRKYRTRCVPWNKVLRIMEYVKNSTKIATFLVIIHLSLFREHEGDFLTRQEVRDIVGFFRKMWLDIESGNGALVEKYSWAKIHWALLSLGSRGTTYEMFRYTESYVYQMAWNFVHYWAESNKKTIRKGFKMGKDKHKTIGLNTIAFFQHTDTQAEDVRLGRMYDEHYRTQKATHILARFPLDHSHQGSAHRSPAHTKRASSPLSSGSCIDIFQLVPSSPTGRSMLPIGDLAESEPDIQSYDEDMMKMDEAADGFPIGSSPQIGHFKRATSSSPGPSWLAALAPNRHDRLFSTSQPSHHRARTWKQPSSSRASPHSSPAGQSERSPSQLRLQAASRLRAMERKNRSNAHRPLLDAFSIGSQRGIDDISSSKEDMMNEAIGRRHIKQMNRHWEALLSSQAYATDEMIEEAEESDSMEEEPIEADIELDFSEIYGDEIPSDAMDSEGPDTSMTSNCSTIRPDEHPQSLLAVLLASSSVCPACSAGALHASDSNLKV
ncbi:hypothetical protein H4Q26_004026 [Puccinia striiformis f. sp. tritici PST-130]|nr:hypothetical protein H4Q26_004026 [Puccinia striiformis f. sp. tritici PST-130]